MKIVAFEVEGWEREAFEALGAEHDVEIVARPLDEKTAGQHRDAEVISTFIYSSLPRKVLEQLPELKLIATRSTGVDHIDLDHCREQGVVVANVPTYGTNTVAEHTFGLLLTISHQLHRAVNRTRRGEFSARGLEGFDLAGRTLGVVGTGDIGRAVIRIAKGFGMEVLAFDIAPDEDFARGMCFRYVALEALLEQADVVTLHVPGNDKTKHMIGADQIARMKEGAILINTSRGSVVETKALVRALAEGKLCSAGLDVLPEEPVIREEAEVLRSVYEERHDLSQLLADHALMRLKNVVVTPHSAFYTHEAVERILDTTVTNIRRYASGEPANVANPEALGA